jgi:AraC family transcriptional regulator
MKRITAVRRVEGLEFSEHLFHGPIRLDAHAHERASLGIVLHGSYRIEADQSRVDVRAPMVAYFPAGVKRSVMFGPGTTLVLWIELSDELSSRIGAPHREPLGFVPLGSGRPEWLAHRVLDEVRREDEASALLLQGRVLELLGTLARSLAGGGPAALPWLARALRALDDSCGGLRLGQLAATCGLHPSHLARAFKQHMGCSVGEYARQSRVSRARCLLTASPLSLAEVAAECGYADQAHFSREFKRLCGTTPLAFRRDEEARNDGAKASRGDKTRGFGADKNARVRRSP